MNWFKMTSLALVAVLCGLLAPPALGQLVGRPIGDDPAFWWTLTDDITPEQLRAELQSREKSRERLRAAIDEGLHDPVSDEKLMTISYFIDGRMTPHLQPMWQAFHRWADRFEYYPGWEQTAAEALEQCSVSSTGAEVVMNASMDHWKVIEERLDEIMPGTTQFVEEVFQPLETRLGRRQTRQMLSRGDHERVARITGKSRAEIAPLYEAWLRDPNAEASLIAIRSLRERLSVNDWNAFRRCLLTKVAPVVRFEGYGEGAFR